jgi:RNA polymerase sigma-70 factor (ECF subfamily)
VDLNDEMIVMEVVSGRHEMFRLLVDRHERQVRGMGLSFFHNTDDADDFAQEVFLKTYHNLAQFAGNARFSTWLYRIAYTTALNQVNRRKQFRSLSEDEYEGSYDTPETEQIKTIVRDAVRKAVFELPEKYRVCVDLFFFYDRSYNEIEMITGFPVNTVKSHIFRAKKLLREKLSAFVEGGPP